MIKKYKHKRRIPNAQRRVLSLAVPQGTLKISFLWHILAYSWWYVDAGIEARFGNSVFLHNRTLEDIAWQTKELEAAIGVKWSNKAFRWALKTAKRIAPLDVEALQNLQAWLQDMRLCTTYQSTPYTLRLTYYLPTTHQTRWLAHIRLYMEELLRDMEWPVTFCRLAKRATKYKKSGQH